MYYCKPKVNLPVDTGYPMTKPDVVKTSQKRRLFYDVLKTSYLHHLEDIQFTAF